ncbi:MAG: hypothetical protein JKX67_01250 [Colwellia sp.]|nr:hypothetical protein [Colwellia sp.]
MELALNEVKIQAKKLLKVLKVESDLQRIMPRTLNKLALTSLAELKLKHCLTIVSQQLGFDNWHHAQCVLSGRKKASAPLNTGTFFYPKGSGAFINEWCANYPEAKSTLINKSKSKYLLPYKNQFIVVTKDYISLFKLDENLMRI